MHTYTCALVVLNHEAANAALARPCAGKEYPAHTNVEQLTSALA